MSMCVCGSQNIVFGYFQFQMYSYFGRNYFMKNTETQSKRGTKCHQTQKLKFNICKNRSQKLQYMSMHTYEPESAIDFENWRLSQKNFKFEQSGKGDGQFCGAL